jgi:indolepyruvate ferredoxin oxidoreductase alpha subunit
MGHALPLEDACAGLGAKFVRVHDPYDIAGMTALLKEAQAHCRGEGGRVAVIISRHPCLLNDKKSAAATNTHRVEINDKCNGCALCRTTFECQALVPGAPVPGKQDRFLTTIDRRVCANCGQCVAVCNRGAIEERA